MNSIPVNITLEWMPENLIEGKPTFVQVKCIGAAQQQAITLITADQYLLCHIASLGHNELIALIT